MYRALFIFVLLALGSCNNNEAYLKNAVIRNLDSFELLYGGGDSVPESAIWACELPGYHEGLVIRFHSDSSYTVVAWGRRESFMWSVLGDKSLTVDVPYNRYKGKDVSLDVKIISSFDLKNKSYAEY
jgi:hypothetical protein